MTTIITRDTLTSLVWALVLTYAIALIPADALAQDGGANPIEDTLCNVVEWMTGGIGKAIATLAIIVVGIGALMGKVSWGMAIIVGLGVAVVFGAGTIVGLLSDGSGGACGGSGGI